MKRIIYLFCTTLFIFSCNEEKGNTGFTIEAHIDKDLNNAIVRLFRQENRKNISLDSTIIIDNKFTLKGQVDQPDMHFITIEGLPGNVPVILENAEIKIEVYADSIFSSDFTGGKETKYFMEYQNFVKSLRVRNDKISNDFADANKIQDTAKIALLRQQYEVLLKENDAYELEYMSKNVDATLSALILERNLPSKKYELNKIKEIYTNFSDDIKKTRPAQAVSDYITTNQKLAIGSPAPEFSGPTPSGETIALNDIRGKVTIIDFWAAWCGPCRKENPNVVRVYEKYHDKGLEIIGVSLDGNPRQKGAKDAWLNAIQKDNLTWYHVSNLQYFNDPIAKQFNINSIPATFIIDEDGLIVAKNLRGQALEDKIEELLN